MSLDLRQLGPYELQERLGHSSVSEVWKAYDSQRHCFVALKVLAGQVRDDPDSAMRFRRDVDVLLSLQYPNLARLYEARILPSRSSQTPSVYLVTDYIEGQTLAAYLRRLP